MLESISGRWKLMATEQKLSVAVLGVCGVLALGLSVYHIRDTIVGPFLVPKSEMKEAKKILGPTYEEQIAKQQRIDSDGDGLSDWDETNVYHLNPNLRDTCGDGLPDNVRVALGRSLTCQVKAAAGGAYLKTGDSTSGPAIPGLGTDQTPSMTLPAGTLVPGLPQDDYGRSVLPRDPAAIRAALQGQVDADKLKNTSDADLLRYYDIALQEAAKSATGTTDQSAQPLKLPE